MKKIRIVNWGKWKFIQHFRTFKPEQAYKDHFNNVFIYTKELEQYLIENGIKYEIDNHDYTFPVYKKVKS